MFGQCRYKGISCTFLTIGWGIKIVQIIVVFIQWVAVLDASSLKIEIAMQTFPLLLKHFLDFEQPVKVLYEAWQQAKAGSAGDAAAEERLRELEAAILEQRAAIGRGLTPWQTVQLSRHPDRPYMLKFVEHMMTDFVELHGDRLLQDDPAMVGGFARLAGETVMVIGQQKGFNSRMRQYRNFGMAQPAGYRKALRLMKLAEKFGKPIITLIDTPGAFPGFEAEEQGGGAAIARNIYEMVRLRVPVICVVIGEGGSGGALGIGVGDKVLMLEHTWYSVVSPESCSAILWRNWSNKEAAAAQLHLTARDMKGFGLVDEIVPEPAGGAQWDYSAAAAFLKECLVAALAEIKPLTVEERMARRMDKVTHIGMWEEASFRGDGLM